MACGDTTIICFVVFGLRKFGDFVRLRCLPQFLIRHRFTRHEGKRTPIAHKQSKYFRTLLVNNRDRSPTLGRARYVRSEEHTSELQSLMRISYAVFCLKKKSKKITRNEEYI